MQALDKRQLRHSFERAAGTYESHAVLQFAIADRMLARLELIKHQPQAIIDVGCGTGYCTEALHRRYRQARVIAVDIAQAMLAQANGRRYRGWRRRPLFLVADAERLALPTASADMVWSNLALQWCDPERVFAEFARILRPGGLLMFTSFGPDTLKELRQAWSAVDAGVHVHDFIDMHDLGDALVRNGFAEPVMDVEHFRMTYPDVKQLLRELKAIGAHNVARSRNHGLTGKDRFARFAAAYEALREDGLIPASYEVVYGHAWKPRATGRQLVAPPGERR